MKYFTKEELEDITNELLGNPTRETLKRLNEKYNGSTEVVGTLLKEEVKMNEAPPVMTPIPNSALENKPVVEIPSAQENTQVAGPIPSFGIPNIEIPKTESQLDNGTNNITIPGFELPSFETPVFNNQNNEPVAFSGNLWNVHQPEMSNLMQTTDNFNAMQSTVPTTEVHVTGAPFFTSNPAPVNNPIPVGGHMAQGPTMFGELEQNYM